MGQLEDDIGARVRLAREHARLNQTQLGRILGVERKTVAAIEKNETRHELTVPEAQKIADATGVPLSFLVIGWAAPPELVELVAELQKRVDALEEGRKTLTREQADFILDELLGDGAKAARGSSRAAGRGRRGAGG